MTKYIAMIGLEMHCEISETKSKVFSSAENSYKSTPNVNVRPLDMGFPGTLPVVNKEAVKMALMASMMLGCSQPEYMYFERKNYYYPDMPKNYQITQETKPIPVGIFGKLDYECNGEVKSVRINNIHLEEDAASQDHYGRYSTIDYNRSCVPLLELVTEPDFRSADEAVAFLQAMRSIYQYTGISEADSKKGQIRCDVNVSIMEADKDPSDPKNWGIKVETKNVNSFSGVRDAINYEIQRQIELKEDGTYDDMEQQTRRWDEESMSTIYMRSKVDAIDYRYFVEPNIPKYKLSKEWLDEIRKSIPRLALERKSEYINNYGLSDYDATILVKEKAVSDFFEELNKNDLKIEDIYMTPKMLNDLIKMVNEGKISSKQSKEIFYKVLSDKKEPKVLVEELGMKQIGDDNTIRELVCKVLDEHLDLIEEHRKGRNVFDFFVGQVMKATRGQANPSMTAKIIREEIEKR